MMPLHELLPEIVNLLPSFADWLTLEKWLARLVVGIVEERTCFIVLHDGCSEDKGRARALSELDIPETSYKKLLKRLEKTS